MTTMFIEKINIKDLEETIANSTPLLAIVGAGDLAVEKIRAARDELAGRAAAFDPKAVRDQAQATFASRVESLQSDLMSAPERIQALPEKAQEWPAKAQSLFADVLSTAFMTYGELAGRGKSRVTQVRREMPAGVEVEVDVDVKPVSRPTTSTARKSTTAAAKRPATKRPATKKPVAKKSTTTTTTTTTMPAAKKAASKRATAKKAASKRATAKKTTTTSTSTSTSTAKKTTSPQS